MRSNSSKISSDLTAVEILDVLEDGGELVCGSCHRKINIFGSHFIEYGDAFTFDCPHCEDNILNISADGVELYHALSGASLNAADVLDRMDEKLTNVMTDDEIEAIRKGIRYCKQVTDPEQKHPGRDGVEPPAMEGPNYNKEESPKGNRG